MAWVSFSLLLLPSERSSSPLSNHRSSRVLRHDAVEVMGGLRRIRIAPPGDDRGPGGAEMLVWLEIGSVIMRYHNKPSCPGIAVISFGKNESQEDGVTAVVARS